MNPETQVSPWHLLTFRCVPAAVSLPPKEGSSSRMGLKRMLQVVFLPRPRESS
jgi:hypothetical protein